MLWRVQQYQPVHQSRQSSLKPTVGSANPSPEPRDHQLTVAAARARHVEMIARCNDMLARADRLEGPEAAEMRAQVLTIVAGLENLSYWIDCVERRSNTLH